MPLRRPALHRSETPPGRRAGLREAGSQPAWRPGGQRLARPPQAEATLDAPGPVPVQRPAYPPPREVAWPMDRSGSDSTSPTLRKQREVQPRHARAARARSAPRLKTSIRTANSGRKRTKVRARRPRTRRRGHDAGAAGECRIVRVDCGDLIPGLPPGRFASGRAESVGGTRPTVQRGVDCDGERQEKTRSRAPCL